MHSIFTGSSKLARKGRCTVITVEDLNERVAEVLFCILDHLLGVGIHLSDVALPASSGCVEVIHSFVDAVSDRHRAVRCDESAWCDGGPACEQAAVIHRIRPWAIRCAHVASLGPCRSAKKLLGNARLLCVSNRDVDRLRGEIV